MSGVIYSFFRTMGTVFLTGLVIKLVDDFLDEELDKLEGKPTISIIWQKAVLPYSLLIFSLAVLLDRNLSISLFLASYLVGMSRELRQKWAIGLNSWQETLIFGGLGCLLLPMKTFLGSVLVMVMVQLIDDFLDYYRDTFSFNENLVFRLGRVEAGLLLMVSTLFSFIILPGVSICVIISFPLLIYLLEARGVKSHG